MPVGERPPPIVLLHGGASSWREFAPLVRLPGNLASPMWLRDRVWFLADHEGHGNLYSVAPDGKDPAKALLPA